MSVIECDSYLHSNGFEKARVSERKLHHLFNLSQLFPTAPDVIVPDVIQTLLLILTPATYHMITWCSATTEKAYRCDDLTLTSRLIGSPSQWTMVSGATMQ